MSRPDWTVFMLIGLMVFLGIVFHFIYNRLDDLEDRMTTLETIRIEAVAPPEGVTP